MKAVRLKTEYLKNPVGIDSKSPRLYWNCEGGIKQTAYQIIAKVNGKTVWNSGKVESSAMTHIPSTAKNQPYNKEFYLWTFCTRFSVLRRHAD